MIEADVYRPFFDNIINTLADIMARRDEAVDSFAETGCEMVQEHTNKFGASNIEQNPLVRLIRDYDKLILSYMRELCLTPSAYKRLEVQQKKVSTLEQLIQEVEGNS